MEQPFGPLPPDKEMPGPQSLPRVQLASTHTASQSCLPWLTLDTKTVPGECFQQFILPACNNPHFALVLLLPCLSQASSILDRSSLP